MLHCQARFDEKPKIVVPSAAIPMVFDYFYVSPFGGHLGTFKTIQKVRVSFLWKNMDGDIRTKMRNCRLCALTKPAENSRLGLLASDVAERPLQKIFID